jgi:TetR/AcrR family transcriptional regulator, cholesterol catabolism regulator
MAGSKLVEIMDTAARMFSERGYQNTSMRDLADEIGLKAGSLYSHIGGKEEVLWNLVSDVGERLVAGAAEAGSQEGPALERLRLYLRRQFEVIHGNPYGVNILTFEWRSLEPDKRMQVKKMRDVAEDHLDQILKDGIKSGEFALDSVKWTRLTVLSIGNWANQWYSPQGHNTPEQLADSFIEVLANGLVPR